MKLVALFFCFNKTILIAYLSLTALYGNERKKDCVSFPQLETPTPVNVVHNHHSVIFWLFIYLNWKQWNVYERQKYCCIMWGRYLWFVMVILGLWTWFYSWNMLGNNLYLWRMNLKKVWENWLLEKVKINILKGNIEWRLSEKEGAA